MKKYKITFILFVVLYSIFTINAFADVKYNYDTEKFYSTDIQDGTIAIGCTVYNEDGTIFGTKNVEEKYFENIIPIKINLNSEFETIKSCFSKNENNLDLQNGVIRFLELDGNKVFIYRNFENKSDNLKAEVYRKNSLNLDFVDNETDEVVARAYNIEEDTFYKPVIDINNCHIKINQEINSYSRSSYPTKTYETGTVPKNIDGNQGKVMISHEIDGDIGEHRVPTLRFDDSTNNMRTINVGFSVSGYNDAYIMNLGLGSRVKSFSAPVGEIMDIIMSTNSNSGEATITIKDGNGYTY